MDRKQFLTAMERLLSLEEGALEPSTNLESTGGWDSMAMLEFQALADERCGVLVAPEDIPSCETAGDLWKLLEGRSET